MVKKSYLTSPIGLLALSLLVFGVSTPTRCFAQTLPFLGRVDPERTSPRQMRANLRKLLKEEESPWLFFANPLASGSNDSWTGEFDLGVAYTPPEGSKARPFTLIGFGGRGKVVEGGSSFSYGGSYGDLTLYQGSILSAKILGVYVKDTSSRTLSGGASFDIQAGESLSLGASAVRSSAKESGETTSSWKYEARVRAVKPFFSQTGQLSVMPKYTFDVDGDDYYEVGLRLDLPAGFKNRSSAVILSAGQNLGGENSTITVGWELDWPGPVR